MAQLLWQAGPQLKDAVRDAFCAAGFEADPATHPSSLQGSLARLQGSLARRVGRSPPSSAREAWGRCIERDEEVSPLWENGHFLRHDPVGPRRRKIEA